MYQTARPPLARMMVIDQELRRKSWPNAATLARRLEVNVRTIRRDIAYLRDQLRAPIEFDREHNGFFYTEPSYRLPYLQFTQSELIALGLAERMIGASRGTPFEKDLKRALAKLQDVLPGDGSIDLESIADWVSVLPGVLSRYDAASFCALAAAVARRVRVEMVYWTASRNQTTRRKVDPYDLALLDGDWYLLGYCHERRSVRIFAVQRIRELKPIEETFDRPPAFRIDQFLQGSFRAIRGDASHDVALRFNPASACRVAEKEWHASQTLEPQPDGSLIVRFHVTDLREIKRWVLSWGADCEVLQPRELCESIVREACQILQRQGVNIHD
jgi:predicted DNA-binding transcriptional regulator YafY